MAEYVFALFVLVPILLSSLSLFLFLFILLHCSVFHCLYSLACLYGLLVILILTIIIVALLYNI